jgi:hypothetical protein
LKLNYALSCGWSPAYRFETTAAFVGWWEKLAEKQKNGLIVAQKQRSTVLTDLQ